jgi:hypothetical protein
MTPKATKIFRIYAIAALAILIYPPNTNFGHSFVFDTSNLYHTIDFGKLAIYETVLLVTTLIVMSFMSNNQPAEIQKKAADEMLLIVLKPMLLRISEKVAMFRLHGMSMEEAVKIMKEANKSMPAIAHPYILSTVKHVYQLSRSDVETLARIAEES